MTKDDELFGDDPGLEGPDYVALVIEWDQIAETIEDELAGTTTERLPRPRPPEAAHPLRVVVAAAGALGALALAAWGYRRVHRPRTA